MIRVIVENVFQLESFLALDNGSRCPVRHFQYFQDGSYRTYLVKVVYTGIFCIGVFLSNDSDQ